MTATASDFPWLGSEDSQAEKASPSGVKWSVVALQKKRMGDMSRAAVFFRSACRRR